MTSQTAPPTPTGGSGLYPDPDPEHICPVQQPTVKVTCDHCHKAAEFYQALPAVLSSAVACSDPNLSSVEITKNAKGERQWSVKVYNADPVEAQRQAVEMERLTSTKYEPNTTTLLKQQ